ncbi:hypothetical protein [Streptomyces sp. 061-3]|uniref:hypothetical protein n=1 Tax=Streptomyces sp. 061-3 TaxID=2789268 RepID=UPI00397FE9BE
MSTKPKTETRRLTSAEKLAARVRGEEIPEAVELSSTPSGEHHLARMRERRAEPARRPPGVSTADFFARHFEPQEESPDDAA